MSIDLKRYAGVEVFPIDDIRINSKLFKNDGITIAYFPRQLSNCNNCIVV